MLSTTWGYAEEIAFDASWQYSSSNPGDSENLNAFNQRYGLGWNPRVTRAILFDANMNYSRNVSTGNIVRETLTPTGSLQLENDLFLAEISGIVNRTNSSISHDQLDRSWEAILASNWEYRFWPNASISFGSTWLNDTEQIHITDTSRQWAEFIAEWELDEFEAYYSYYKQLRDDYVEQTNYDEMKHFGRIDYSRSFFADRVNVSFSGQLTDSTTDFTATFGGQDNIAIGVGLSQGLAGIDPLPESGTLPAAPALIDGNKSSVAFAINLHEVANLGIKTDLQTVDTLYLYTGQIDPLLIAETGALHWDLYSSDDGINWQREATNPATSYDRDRFRYRVDISSLQRIYLKLVVTAWPTSLAIPITEIEAYRHQDGTGSDFTEIQEYTRRLTDLNLRYTPIPNTSLSYSLVWDDSDYSIGNDRERIFQTAGLRWWHSQYFIPSLTVNSTSTTNSAIADTSQLSYALSIQSTLLPTLEANLGLTRNENTTDDLRQTTNHTVNLNLLAALYPNLDSTLDLSTNFSKNEELETSNENLALRWTLTARLRPDLIVDFITEHGSTGLNFNEIVDTEESGGRTTLNANWRPSDLLSILVNASRGYGEQWSNYESFLLDANLSLIRTSKAQMIVGYKINSIDSETFHILNGNWSWNISEFFTMQAIANYLITTQEDNSWFFNARLTTRF
jgi:hypothetical protein